MSCYTRHLDELLPDGPRPAARRELDAAIRGVLVMPDADCPDVWAQVKDRRGPDFDDAVRQRLAQTGGGAR